MLRDISRRYFADEFELNEPDVEELIQEALTTLAKGIEKLEQCFDQGHEAAELKEIAHALKGNLLNMGLPDQAQKALDVEDELEQDRELARSHFLALKRELENF
ncbi:Hpt domain-containing protein [Pseudodesulfovibrio senegalensis]|uniref:HPt domain-containing protein n=1 Tax=Pseudodesulfovibrio senegalensis TaxID=1721087 RepID=A0A6N6N2R3_9BACT|nr:Hpt domain-containing protein [Pseudodesulfovibrio senegalensis]KAB1442231.1 hypothetical protein F8A88_07175 [Pseudodesulfovibrio senegalensis]